MAAKPSGRSDVTGGVLVHDGCTHVGRHGVVKPLIGATMFSDSKLSHYRSCSPVPIGCLLFLTVCLHLLMKIQPYLISALTPA